MATIKAVTIRLIKDELEVLESNNKLLEDLNNEAVEGMTGTLKFPNGKQLELTENEVFEYVSNRYYKNRRQIKNLRIKMDKLEGEV